jgi:hypothetical protein
VYNQTECLDEANYVMSTSNKQDNVLNSFYFSSCSIDHFVDILITQNEFACLLKSPSDTKKSESLESDEFIAGQLYDADEQCKQNFGPNFKLM